MRLGVQISSEALRACGLVAMTLPRHGSNPRFKSEQAHFMRNKKHLDFNSKFLAQSKTKFFNRILLQPLRLSPFLSTVFASKCFYSRRSASFSKDIQVASFSRMNLSRHTKNKRRFFLKISSKKKNYSFRRLSKKESFSIDKPLPLYRLKREKL